MHLDIYVVDFNKSFIVFHEYLVHRSIGGTLSELGGLTKHLRMYSVET